MATTQEYQKEYYQKNKERKKKYFRDKYKENPKKYIARTSDYHASHPEVAKKASQKWEANNPEKVRAKNKKRSSNSKDYFRNWHLKSFYGISLDDYNKMYDSQNGKCLICEKETTLVVDHDHKTGKVRGLLCHNCNRALGSIKESIHSLERAILYLKEYNS